MGTANKAILTHSIAALVLLALIGCGGGNKVGTVSGKVTYKGEALRGGTLAFVPKNAGGVVATIDPEGNYTVTNVPVGEAKITVQTFPATGGPPAMKGKAPPKMPQAPADQKMPDLYDFAGKAKKGHMKIPEKYGDPEKSGLTYTVSAGSQTHNIKLE